MEDKTPFNTDYQALINEEQKKDNPDHDKIIYWSLVRFGKAATNNRELKEEELYEAGKEYSAHCAEWANNIANVITAMCGKC